MKICVINGSPKGQSSVTLQTVYYLEKHFPSDSFTVLDVGQKIRALENSEEKLNAAINVMLESDLMLFSYPVYTFIAPAQLHKFIELVKKSPLSEGLKGKLATQISTSKHFYDVTAHKYIEDNCNDLGLSYFTGLSADMDDLTKAKGRKEAFDFWQAVRYAAANGLFKPAREIKAPRVPVYKKQITSAITAKSTKYDTVIITNATENDKSLNNMISDFRKMWPYGTRVVNLNEFKFSGGCLGCFNCASSGKCIYKDNFDSYLRNNIQTADAIVYAVKIADHSFGSRFKLYNDRQFCNGHRTVTSGMPIGYIFSGAYESEMNVQMITLGRAQVGGNYLAGIVSDEYDTYARLENLCKTLEYSLDAKLTQPANFYGVGGMKIFRDLIYVMRGLMKEDHRFYKEHGVYDDLPQKHLGTLFAMKLVGGLMSIPGATKKSGMSMTKGMLMPYKAAMNKMDCPIDDSACEVAEVKEEKELTTV